MYFSTELDKGNKCIIMQFYTEVWLVLWRDLRDEDIPELVSKYECLWENFKIIAQINFVIGHKYIIYISFR